MLVLMLVYISQELFHLPRFSRNIKNAIKWKKRFNQTLFDDTRKHTHSFGNLFRWIWIWHLGLPRVASDHIKSAFWYIKIRVHWRLPVYGLFWSPWHGWRFAVCWLVGRFTSAFGLSLRHCFFLETLMFLLNRWFILIREALLGSGGEDLVQAEDFHVTLLENGRVRWFFNLTQVIRWMYANEGLLPRTQGCFFLLPQSGRLLTYCNWNVYCSITEYAATKPLQIKSTYQRKFGSQ